jgi:hypothetical protein
MPIVVVAAEKNLKGLTDRLLVGGASRAATARAAAAIRAANPNLDLDRLRPGVVVVVPELERARAEVGDVVEPGLAGARDLVLEQLGGFGAAADAGEAAEAEVREQTATALEDPAVKRAAERDPALRALLDELADAFPVAAKEADQRRRAMAAALRQWKEDLDSLG